MMKTEKNETCCWRWLRSDLEIRAHFLICTCNCEGITSSFFGLQFLHPSVRDDSLTSPGWPTGNLGSSETTTTVADTALRDLISATVFMLFGNTGADRAPHTYCMDDSLSSFKFCSNVTFEGSQQWSENNTCPFSHSSTLSATSPN